MNMRLAALSVVLAALVAGVFVAVGGHGSAEAAKTPGTCIEMLHDSFSDHSVPWDLGPDVGIERPGDRLPGSCRGPHVRVVGQWCRRCRDRRERDDGTPSVLVHHEP